MDHEGRWTLFLSCHDAVIATRRLASTSNNNSPLFPVLAVSISGFPFMLVHLMMLSLQLVLGLTCLLVPSVKPVITEFSIESSVFLVLCPKSHFS